MLPTPASLKIDLHRVVFRKCFLQFQSLSHLDYCFSLSQNIALFIVCSRKPSNDDHSKLTIQLTMRISIITFALSTFVAATFAVPFGDTFQNLDLELDLEVRNSNPFIPRRQSPAASSCVPQNPIASNVCSSGSPYCCSGSGKSTVCGPASTTKCASTTICCINTNGVS